MGKYNPQPCLSGGGGGGKSTSGLEKEHRSEGDARPRADDMYTIVAIRLA